MVLGGSIGGVLRDSPHEPTIGGTTTPLDERPFAGVDLATIDPTDLSKTQLHELILESEHRARQAKADYYQLCAEAKRRKGPSADQYRNETLWLADSLRIAKGTAGGVLKRGALMFSIHTELGDAYRAGTIRDEHLDLFARIWNKPALRSFLTRDLTALIGFTRNDWPTCNSLFQSWEILVDPVDPNEYAERAHTDRSLTFTSPVQQHVIMEILTTTAAFAFVEPAIKVLTDELFEADWAEARARIGDGATMEDLHRSDTQRRHDALFRLIRNGIGADPATANLVANVVVDNDTLDEQAERRDAEARGETFTPCTLTTEEACRRAATRRCETESGRPISPADALDIAIAGHVRLFVMNTKTRNFEASAKTRLFTGAQRLGIMIRDRHCQGLGCDTRAWHCDTDHTIRHCEGGQTVPTNGEPRCGPCHRHKTRLENLGLWPPGP